MAETLKVKLSGVPPLKADAILTFVIPAGSDPNRIVDIKFPLALVGNSIDTGFLSGEKIANQLIQEKSQKEAIDDPGYIVYDSGL